MKSTGISLPKLLSLPYLNLAGDTSTSVPIEALFEKYLQCEDNYIARVDPTPNSNFFIQIQNRLQTTLHVIYLESFPPFNWYPVLQETSNTWINLHHLLTFLPMDWNGLEKQNDSLYFVWGSERTGYMQLYLYEFDLQSHTANILNPIGEHGDWVVDSILSVDDKNSLVYYMGNREHPTEKHVYVSPLVSSHKGPNIARLTHESGWYQDVVVDTDKHILYGNYSNLNTPPVLFCSKFPDLIHQLTNLPLQAPEYTVLFRNYTSSDPSALSQSSPSGLLISPLSMLRTEVLMNKLRIPELHTIEHVHDGQKIQLHCHALLPDPNLYGPGPYPCIVAVYGGPHVQRVTNGWVCNCLHFVSHILVWDR